MGLVFAEPAEVCARLACLFGGSIVRSGLAPPVAQARAKLAPAPVLGKIIGVLLRGGCALLVVRARARDAARQLADCASRTVPGVAARSAPPARPPVRVAARAAAVRKLPVAPSVTWRRAVLRCRRDGDRGRLAGVAVADEGWILSTRGRRQSDRPAGHWAAHRPKRRSPLPRLRARGLPRVRARAAGGARRRTPPRRRDRTACLRSVRAPRVRPRRTGARGRRGRTSSRRTRPRRR